MDPIILRTQYRCHPAISKVSNDLFYDNQVGFGGLSVCSRPVVLISLLHVALWGSLRMA
jgi:hypothetical protein